MDSRIVSRAQAKQLGLNRYFTGVACRNGHISNRYTVNGLCHGCASQENKKSYQSNIDSRRERNRTYYEVNADKERARIARYIKQNSGRYSRHSAARRASIAGAMPPWLTAEQLDQIALTFIYARAWTLATGVPHDVDHIVPLRGKTVCGLHVPWNLRVISAKSNRKKSNRLQT